MNGARVLLECLKKEGVDTIFGYPGGAVIPLYDALYDYKEDFTHIRTSHEQGSVHAADGYARSTNKVGVCFTTSGPGATNAITGIATGYMDSTPLVVITGQVPSNLLGKDSFQEIDTTGMTLSITKHNYLVRRVEDIANVVKEAFKVSNEPRKGPVLIDIPKDLFLAELDFDVDNYVPYQQQLSEKSNNKNNDKYYELIKEASTLIKNSIKPVIYAGGGVKSSDSEDLLEKFATKINTPVLNTLMGLGNIDRSNELSLGMVGMHGSSESNLALSNSDLVIAIGARFSDRVVGKTSEFAKNASIIHIDIDPSEIGKNTKSNVSLVGDLRIILEDLLNEVEDKNNESWLQEIKSYESNDFIEKEEFHPKNIFSLVDKNFNYDSVIVTDVGQHQMWAAKYFNFKKGKNFITSAGLGTMGFGLGAAIGTKLGNNNKNVILVTGDGSFKMNCNELATLSQYNINVVIILLNNSALGMVRQWQKLFSNERYSETDIVDNVNYVALAKAYNLDAYKATNLLELQDILQSKIKNRSVLIQCDINKDYDVYPIVAPNATLDSFICN